MSNKFKNKWIYCVILFAIALMLIVCMILDTTRKTIPLSLVIGEKKEVSIFRFGSSELVFRLKFTRNNSVEGDRTRPELGYWLMEDSIDDYYKNSLNNQKGEQGITTRDNLIEPVIINVLVNDNSTRECTYSSISYSAINHSHIWLHMYMSTSDIFKNEKRLLSDALMKNINRYKSKLNCNYNGGFSEFLPFGFSHVQFSIIEAGERLSGQDIVLEIMPPSIPIYVQVFFYILVIFTALNGAILLFKVTLYLLEKKNKEPV